MRGRILIVDDDQSTCEVLNQSLRHREFDVAWHTSASQAIEAIEKCDFDAVVADMQMPEMNGIELCDRITANRPSVPVIVITAFGSLDSAVAAIRAGAYDFITKPFEIEQLALSLDRAIHHRQLKEEVRRLRETAGESDPEMSLLGNSSAMRNVRSMIRRVAGTDSSILITGETGTGKELVARELHMLSRRNSDPFVAVNCAAVPETLMESEMFGHVKGAFTDARQAKTGLFMQATGGTLFLDEISSMPLAIQPKLLRALQERSVRPVGGSAEFPFDVRIVCATNADLESAVEEGRFRQDLLYRINVVQISLPPLRSRAGDSLQLAQHFVTRFANLMNKPVQGLGDAAAERIRSYDWPGNVRELQNAMERAVAMANRELILVEDLPDKLRYYHPTQLLDATDSQELVTLEELERRYIHRVLEAVKGNKTEAARILGLDRTTLYRKLDRHAN